MTTGNDPEQRKAGEHGVEPTVDAVSLTDDDSDGRGGGLTDDDSDGVLPTMTRMEGGLYWQSVGEGGRGAHGGRRLVRWQ